MLQFSQRVDCLQEGEGWLVISGSRLKIKFVGWFYCKSNNNDNKMRDLGMGLYRTQSSTCKVKSQ